MKRFNELKEGDVIYYYDHCKMRPRIVERIEWETEEVEKNFLDRLRYDIKPFKWLKIYIKKYNKPLRILCTRHNGNIDRIKINHSQYYPCKELAEQSLYTLRKYRADKVEKAKKILEKETKRLNKYEIL